MFTVSLRHELRRRGIDVRYVEHDLIGESREAGEQPGAGRGQCSTSFTADSTA